VVVKAVESVLVGLGIAAVCFVPYLAYQYRRYGQFSASRLVWSAALLIYGTALASYTLFPLPSAAYCARPHDLLVLDPTVYFRDMWAMHRDGQAWTDVLTSWTCLQLVLNVLLFMPLGVVVRHLWQVRVLGATLLGCGISLLIETTQFTGNWFTAPCPYRVADVGDVMTNTLGAWLGAVIALVIPRLAADPDVMAAARNFAKPVTRGRRYAGMLFDVAWAGLVYATVRVAMAVVYVGVMGADGYDRAKAFSFGQTSAIVSQVVCLVLVLLPALIGSGASMGQRLVYLKPVPGRPNPRLWLVVRALVVAGVALVLLFWGAHWLAWAWLITAVVWVLPRPRGLSLTVAGCQLVDTRVPAGGAH